MDISAFTARLIKVLNAPQEGTWSVPRLHLHAGPPEPARLSGIRRGIPGSVFLLYLHNGGESDSENLLAAVSDSERSFAVAADDPLLPKKIGALLGILKCEGQAVTFTSDGEPYADALSSALPLLRDGLSQIKCEMRSRLIRLRCSLRNLPSILKNNGRSFQKLPAGTVAIVCGAGPSLSSQLDLLKKHAGRFVLIAVGRAFPILAGAGITPDLVLEIDPACGDRYPKDWPEGDRSALAALPSIAPDFAAHFEQVLWLAEPGSPFNKLLAELGIEVPQVSLGRSVIISALDSALRLGASKTALIGSDLAFSKSLASHAGGASDFDGDEASLTELEGNDGERLVSNTLFCGMKAALEDYLAKLGETSKIFNCSKGGAKIQNLEYVELEKFCEDLPKARGAFELLSPAPEKRADSEGKIAKLSSDFKSYALASSASLQNAEKLFDEISQADGSDEDVLNAKKQLQSSLAEEQKCGQVRLTPFLSAPIIAQTDEALSYMPALLSGASENIRGQVCALIERARLINGFCADISGDLECAVGKSEKRNLSPFIFEAFRSHALRFVGRKNPEFSELLVNIDANSFQQDFELSYNWQDLPIVRRIMKDGSRFCLSSSLEMEMQAIRENAVFAKDVNYDPESCAVIFLAPGNWVNAVEFVKAFPQGEFMALEPWPELFAAIMGRCLFLHHFPKESLILCSDRRLKHWKRLFHAQRREWQRAGKRIIMHTQPRTWQLPEVKALLEGLPE